MNRMKRVIIIAVLVHLYLGLNACAWVGMDYGGFESINTEIDNPNLTTFSLHSCSLIHSDTYGALNSLDEMLEFWGEPDKRYFQGKEQHLIYERELIWSGVKLVLLIVPIPLLIPTDRGYCKVVVSDGKVTKLIRHHSEADTFVGCWFYPELHTGSWEYGCGKKKS